MLGLRLFDGVVVCGKSIGEKEGDRWRRSMIDGRCCVRDGNLPRRVRSLHPICLNVNLVSSRIPPLANLLFVFHL